MEMTKPKPKLKARINNRALKAHVVRRSTQSIVASWSCITESTLSNMLKGKTNPSLATCQSLTETLQLTEEEFLEVFYYPIFK